MNWSFKQIIQSCIDNRGYYYLKSSGHGLEKESLRITPQGKLSQQAHPSNLGSALTHPHISTDFSEAQLELITPYFPLEEKAISFLENLHLFIYPHLNEEMLWPFSTPCFLPNEKNIPLAYYGNSRDGIKKNIYRQGLSFRYGKSIQMLSGIHYNFSFSKDFLHFLHEQFNTNLSKQAFISQAYLSLIRNFLRMNWINTYFFGASPVVDESYLNHPNNLLKKIDSHSYYGEHATSIRLSDLGYYSKVQTQIAISYNKLSSYIQDLSQAISNVNPQYQKIKLYNEGKYQQLNSFYLQNESEHYSLIRPKPQVQKGESILHALQERGISYVEVRTIDLNPFNKNGIELDQLLFLHIFMVYCLFKESPPLSKPEQKILTENQNKVALFGRKPQIHLHHEKKGSINMKHWAENILNEMNEIAILMDKNHSNNQYSKSIEKRRQQLNNPALIPSNIFLENLKNYKGNLQKFGLNLAKNHKNLLSKNLLSAPIKQHLTKLSKLSIQEEKTLSTQDNYVPKDYENIQPSNQKLRREAQLPSTH